MNKYIFLISVFLISCSKEDKPNRVSIRQQPSIIAIFSVDTLTFTETLLYNIQYFFNDTTERFDSIIIAGNKYVFNYSQLNTNNTILLNYVTTLLPYDAILFERNYFSMIQYNEIYPATEDTIKNILQYENGNRVKFYSFSKIPADENFEQLFSYKNDSVFIRTKGFNNSCETNDTIIQSFYEMNTKLPYWLFLNISTDCGSISSTVLKALPISNYINKLPFKKVNGATETNYVFKGDSNFRLGEALLTSKKRNTNELVSIQKIKVTY